MRIYYLENADHGQNIYSQYGEDGLISKIAADLNISMKIAMEFGAWDGKHFSNTFAKVDNFKTLILVEGDPIKYEILKETARDFAQIIPVLAFVEPTGQTSVDAILEKNLVEELDLLSVDIDGGDLAIVEELSVRPRILIVEFNGTFGALTQYKNETGKSVGSSFLSFYNLMAARNYSLVAMTTTNLLFVDDEIIEREGYTPLRFSNLSLLTQIDSNMFKIACGYDGTRLSFGRSNHPWDGSKLAKVYRYPQWAYGWEPTYLQLAYRLLRTQSITEIIKGIKKARNKGWFTSR